MCDETYTCVCTSKCNTEICKTKCNGGVAFTFANEFCLFFLGKTVDKLTVHRYNNRAAIIVTGGKQYKVSEGDVIYIEKLDNEAGDTVKFEQVLAIIDGEKATFGAPVVEGASVEAKIVKNGKGKKIRIFKYNPKKGYRKRQGHRQPYTKVEIGKISV